MSQDANVILQRQLQAMQQRNTTLASMYEEILMKYTESYAECNRYKKSTTKYESLYVAKEQLYRGLGEQLMQKNTEIQQWKTQLQIEKNQHIEECKTNEQTKMEYTFKVNQLETDIDGLKKGYNALYSTHESMKKQYERNMNLMQNMNKESEKMDQLKKDKTKLIDKTIQLMDDINIWKNLYNGLKSYNQKMKEQYEKNKNSIQDMNGQIDKLKEHKRKLLDKNNKLMQQNNKLQQENNKYLNSINNLNEQNDALHSEIENLKNKHNAFLRTMIEKHDEKVGRIKDNYQRKLDKQKTNNVTLQQELSQQIENLSHEKNKLLQQTQNTADNEQLQQHVDDISISNTKLHKERDEMKETLMNIKKQNEMYMKRIDEYRQEIAMFNSQDQNECIESLQLQIEKVKLQIDNNLLQYERSINSLSAENEQLKKQLEKKLNGYKLEEYHCNPCDDEEDDAGIYVNDDEKKDNLNSYQVSDDELCQKLQEDLENYISDQKKRRKHPLQELRIFHEKKSQIIRNWDTLLYKNYLKSVWEKLVDEIEDKYDDEDNDIDAEKLAYNILFDIVIECYDVLHTEHNKIYQNEYMSPKVIDMVWMNIDNFYDLIGRNKLKKRITNIYKYINNMINEIYKRVETKHANDMVAVDMAELFKFIVNCSEIIWSVLHYDFTISPLNFLLHSMDTKYDLLMHETDGDCRGNNIEYYVFPAMMKENKYQTKIWVICDDIE